MCIYIYILFHTIWYPGKRACISQMQRYGFMMIHSVMTSTLPMWLLRAKNFLNHNLWHEKPLGNILVSCDKIYPFPSFQHVLGQSTKDQKGAQQNKPVARTKKCRFGMIICFNTTWMIQTSLQMPQAPLTRITMGPTAVFWSQRCGNPVSVPHFHLHEIRVFLSHGDTPNHPKLGLGLQYDLVHMGDWNAMVTWG